MNLSVKNKTKTDKKNTGSVKVARAICGSLLENQLVGTRNALSRYESLRAHQQIRIAEPIPETPTDLMPFGIEGTETIEVKAWVSPEIYGNRFAFLDGCDQLAVELEDESGPIELWLGMDVESLTKFLITDESKLDYDEPDSAFHEILDWLRELEVATV